MFRYQICCWYWIFLFSTACTGETHTEASKIRQTATKGTAGVSTCRWSIWHSRSQNYVHPRFLWRYIIKIPVVWFIYFLYLNQAFVSFILKFRNKYYFYRILSTLLSCIEVCHVELNQNIDYVTYFIFYLHWVENVCIKRKMILIGQSNVNMI